MFGFFKSKPKSESKTIGPSVLKSNTSQLSLQSVHSFKKKFDHELDGWCFGLENLGEEPLPQVVFRVIREFRPIFAEAISEGYVFDIDVAARRLCESSNKVVPLKEIAMALVAILPDPEELPVEQKRIYTLVLAQVELSHSGAVNRIKQKVQGTRPIARGQAEDSARQTPPTPPLLVERV